jgi:hypothetical protein
MSDTQHPNGLLYAAAIEAIERLFGDMTVSQARTKELLEELSDEISIMIEGLDPDVELDEGEEE